MNRHVLGIDLATKATGVVLGSVNEIGYWKIIYKNTLILERFCHDNMQRNIRAIKNEFIKFKCYNNLEIYIELGNYDNASLTSKFSFYAGIIGFIFPDAKIIFPVVWQKYLKVEKFERKQLKAASRLVTENIFGDRYVWTEDECDAFCLILFSDRFIKGDYEWAIEKKSVDKTKKTKE